MEPTTITVAVILGHITTAVTNAATWLGTGATSVTSSPMALAIFAVGFCGIGIGLFKRIVRIF